MDPTQCLADLLDRLNDAHLGVNTRQEAVELAEALTEWLRSGGFVPSPYEAIDRSNIDASALDHSGEPDLRLLTEY